MTTFCMAAMVALPLLWAAPDAGVPAGFEHGSSAMVEQMDQKLDATSATEPHRFAVLQMSDYANDSVLPVRRKADGPPEWHETHMDVIFVRSGSATLVVGGTLVNGETVAPHEKRNGTMEGGTREKLGPGDVVRIPPAHAAPTFARWIEGIRLFRC
jgi:mannose-6-phosphate isomerase-like protein (cupin superfamily)